MIIALTGGIFFNSCLKKDSRKDTEENLKTAMDLYLNHQRQIDTSRVKFKVLEVTFFEGKLGYICNFKVNMKERRDRSNGYNRIYECQYFERLQECFEERLIL